MLHGLIKTGAENDQLEWTEEAETALRNHYNRFYRDQEISSLRTLLHLLLHLLRMSPTSSTTSSRLRRSTRDLKLLTNTTVTNLYTLSKKRSPNRWHGGETTGMNILLISKMAIDLFSVPAMSAECERVFSQAKLVITSQRHHLNAETLEAILCLEAVVER